MNHSQKSKNVTSNSYTLGILSLVFGILSLVNTVFVGSLIFGPLAIVFFILALIKQPRAKVIAIIGGVLGVIGLLIGVTFTVPQLLSIKPDEIPAYELSERAAFDSKKDFSKGEVARIQSFDVTVNSVSAREDSGNDKLDRVTVGLSLKNISNKQAYSIYKSLELKVGDSNYKPEMVYFGDQNYKTEPGEVQTGTISYLVKKGSDKPQAIQYVIEHIHDVYSNKADAYKDLVWSLAL